MLTIAMAFDDGTEDKAKQHLDLGAMQVCRKCQHETLPARPLLHATAVLSRDVAISQTANQPLATGQPTTIARGRLPTPAVIDNASQPPPQI